MALRSRLEKQPTDLRRQHHYMRDGALDDPLLFEQPHLEPSYKQDHR
jgi:hypothetical protein